jgi:glutamate synthase domain-containing protein 2
MAMGADGIALSNSAIQAVGCIGARMCNTNNCPAGIATQKPQLRALINVDAAAQRLATFFGASVELMQVLARACGHGDLHEFTMADLTTWKRDIADLSGVSFGGPTDS